jgi:hypothetical protein
MGRKKTQDDQEPGLTAEAPIANPVYVTDSGASRPVTSHTGQQPVPRKNAQDGNGTGGARVPPVHTVQCGRIRGVVWRNTGSEGEWFSVSVTRSYKDNANPPQWKQATTFGRDDLLVVSEVTRALWAWIVQRQTAGTETGKPAPTSDETIPF